MATITPQDVPVIGDTITWTPASVAGDEAVTDSVLLVRNESAGTRTLTVITPGTVSGIALADVQVSIAAGEIGVVPLGDVYKSSATRRASFSVDVETTVDYAVIRTPR